MVIKVGASICGCLAQDSLLAGPSFSQELAKTHNSARALAEFT